MYCISCGAAVSSLGKFCASCGSRIGGASETVGRVESVGSNKRSYLTLLIARVAFGVGFIALLLGSYYLSPSYGFFFIVAFVVFCEAVVARKIKSGAVPPLSNNQKSVALLPWLIPVVLIGISFLLPSIRSLSSRPTQVSVEQQLEEKLRNASREENLNLPRMVDETLRLDRVVIQPGPEVVYWHTFPGHTSHELSNQIDKTSFGERLRSDACTTSVVRSLLQRGATYVHVYRSSEGDEVARFSVNARDCDLPVRQ